MKTIFDAVIDEFKDLRLKLSRNKEELNEEELKEIKNEMYPLSIEIGIYQREKLIEQNEKLIDYYKRDLPKLIEGFQKDIKEMIQGNYEFKLTKK